MVYRNGGEMFAAMVEHRMRQEDVLAKIPGEQIREAARVTLDRLWRNGGDMTTADHALLNLCISSLDEMASIDR